jgi:class 3 adenylate cyclase
MKDETDKLFRGPLRELERSQQELERRIFHLKTLYDLSQEIGFLGGPSDIMRNLLMMIIGTFGASSGFILLADMGMGKIKAFTQRSMVKNSIDTLSQMVESGYFKELNKISGIQILDERDKVQGEGRQKIFDLLFSYNIKAWIPFNINENLRGGIGLGDKLSGDSYTTDDQELLSTMAHQGVVAITNSMLVEQMKKDESVRANLARYLSPQIVEQIIKKNMQVNLGGDRKVVTVLFSDIRNFIRISENLAPDQLTRLLNEYFTEMARIIFENHGSLDKFIGDAIVAVFGSLIELENPARAAVHAGIQMMKALATANERWTAQYGVAINIGIGINTGEVFLGNIGSPERMEFTVIGDTVNIASRFSGVAHPGQILVTRETLSCLASDIHHRELPPIEVKGKTGKLAAFEMIYR